MAGEWCTHAAAWPGPASGHAASPTRRRPDQDKQRDGMQCEPNAIRPHVHKIHQATAQAQHRDVQPPPTTQAQLNGSEGQCNRIQREPHANSLHADEPHENSSNTKRPQEMTAPYPLHRCTPVSEGSFWVISTATNWSTYFSLCFKARSLYVERRHPP